MTIRNVLLVAGREVRDHLRDRRTIAMMVVLPLVLYPVLGLSIYQLAQFLEEKPCRVLLVGTESLQRCTEVPPLTDAENPGRFHPSLFVDQRRQRLLEVVPPDQIGLVHSGDVQKLRQQVEERIAQGQIDAALWFPPDFPCLPADQNESPTLAASTPVKGAEILYSTASDRSQIAYGRLQAVLDRWRDRWQQQRLLARGVPKELIEPFPVAAADVAISAGRKGAALWAKLLPILLIVWAATGAFYPAIDACAGEKERGTLETLLVSPAERLEIVLGKLCAVTLFSAITALTNVASMMLSGWILLASLPQFGPPPWGACAWLPLVVLPVSLLFSAISLALAAQARSSREAQYYLMPVVMGVMPLVLLPMTPGVELSWGTSVIPITGLVLVLKSLLAGQLGQEGIYLLPAGAVTLTLCVAALRWAVQQFHSENILFREAEVLSVRLLLARQWQRRGIRLTPSQAIFAGLLMLLVKLAWSIRATMPADFAAFAQLQLAAQLGAFALPAVVFAFLFSRRPTGALGFRRCSPWLVVAAALLALLVQPAGAVLQQAFLALYPPGEVVTGFLQEIQSLVDQASLPELLFYLAFLPAVCEELAFRGIILGGFAGWRRFVTGIIVSSFLFAAAHTVLVQQLSAFVLGLILAAMVVTTGSLWPAMAFHLVYNGGMLLAARNGADSAVHLLFRQLQATFPMLGELIPQLWLALVAVVAALVLWGASFGWKPARWEPGPREGQNPLPTTGHPSAGQSAHAVGTKSNR
jgi:sodium transport system permease protein